MLRSFARFLLAAVLSTSALAEPVALSGPVLFDTGPGKISQLAGGDFDRDGKRDFLVVHYGVAISVHRGRGDGTFEPPVTTPIDEYGSMFASGDLNADAVPDLVLDYTVFFGNGDGTFRESATLPRIEYEGAMAIGEFTGDARADVLLHSYTLHGEPDTISVFPGDGAGHFRTPFVTESDVGARSVAMTDLNHDGKLDLVTGGSSGSAWLGTGHGTFAGRVWFSDGQDIALADFNGDGHVDRAATDMYHNDVYVSLGKGDGTFHDVVSWRTAYGMEHIVAADMNLDGRVDLVAGSSGGRAVTVLLGRGDGTFDPPRIHSTGVRTSRLITGDFTGDGSRDVLTVEYDSNAVAFLRGNGHGTLDAPRVFLTSLPELSLYPDVQAAGLRLLDFTGDGNADAFTLTESGFSVLPGDSKGAFGTPIVTEVFDVGGHAVGDFTGDARLDVVVMGDDAFTLYAGNGDGTFRQSTVSARIEGEGSMVAGDFTADGKLDLATSSWRLIVYPNDGGGAFSTGPISENVKVDDQRGVVDVNRDGKVDLVQSSERVFLSDGTGRFTVVTSESAGGEVVGLGDLDGDGNVDVVSQSYDLLFVHRGNGDGTFAPSSRFQFNREYADRVSYAWSPAAFADISGDGYVDLIHGLSALFGDGRGAFTGYQELRVLVSEIDVADLDGNGSPDIVALDHESGQIEVVLTRVKEGLDRPVTVTLASSLDSARYAEEVTFSARVATDSGHELRGAIRFDVDGELFAILAPDEEGKASIAVRFASVGSHTVTATYARTDLHASAAASRQQDVVKGTVQLVLRGGPNPVVAGQPVTMTLFDRTTGGRPTGTVVLRDGPTILGTIDLSLTRRFTTSFATPGTHTITAEYAGNENFEPAAASYGQQVTGGRRRSVR